MTSPSKRFREILAQEWSSNPLCPTFREISLPILTPPKSRQVWRFLLPDPRFSRLCEMREFWRNQKRADYWVEVKDLSQWLSSLPLHEDWIIWQPPESVLSSKRYRSKWGFIDYNSQPLISFTLAHFTLLDEFDGFYQAYCPETGEGWSSELFAILARFYGFTEVEPICTKEEGRLTIHGYSGYPPGGCISQVLSLSSVLARLEYL